MKQILPILTLTTLTAAAFADAGAAAPAAPAASGFNYNTVSVAYTSDDFKNSKDNLQLTSLTFSNKIAKNIVGSLGLLNGSESGANEVDLQGFSVGLGYVYTINTNFDIVASWTHILLQTSESDSQNINFANYEVGARYNVGNGLELNASIGRNNYMHEDTDTPKADVGTFRTSYSVGAAYKINNDLTLSAKATWNSAAKSDLADSRGYTVGLSYNY